MTVAFFGHSTTPNTVIPRLEQEILRIVENEEDITFLVGAFSAKRIMRSWLF